MNIQKYFPDRAALLPHEANFALFGYARQTTANQLSAGRFKLPVTSIDGVKVVLIDDLQKFIDDSINQSVKKRRGPRTKAERFALLGGGDHA